MDDNYKEEKDKSTDKEDSNDGGGDDSMKETSGRATLLGEYIATSGATVRLIPISLARSAR